MYKDIYGWKRMLALFTITSVASFAIEFNDLLARVYTRDLNIRAQTATAMYQVRLAQTETRWSNTEFALGTVNMGLKEWELSATQALELGDRPTKRGAIVKAEMKVTEAEKVLRQAEIALLIHQEFNAIQLADRSAAVLDSQIQETILLQEWQRKMVVHGSLDPLDTLRTLVALEILIQEKSNWTKQRLSAIRNLGVFADTVFAEGETFVHKKWPVPTTNYQVDQTQGNPRLAVSATSISIADADVDLQKMLMQPELGISAGIVGGESYDALLGVSVSIPLFTSNPIKTMAAQEKRSAVQATHDARVKEEKAFAQRMQNQLNILANEYEHIDQKLLPLEQQVLAISRQRYEQGTLPHSQLWEQIVAVNRLELRKLDLQAQFAKDAYELSLFPEMK